MKTTRNILKYKKAYLLFSLVLVLLAFVFVLVFRLKMSTDFTGGSVFVFSRQEGEFNDTRVREILQSNSVEAIELWVQESGKGLEFKTNPLSTEQSDKVRSDLLAEFTGSKQESFETLGSSIGKETQRKSVFAFLIACVGIVTYIAYAFRNIPKPYSGYRFGVSAIIAMVHDAVVVIGAFALLHKLYGVEIDPMFVTALLTVIGFSVHDTIVVFDRIRENLPKFKGKSFEEICNYSVLETLRRSVATSLTVVITLSSLFIFGGDSTRWFVFALLVGIISGTYSSIFTATPVLIVWEKYISTRSKSKK